tara:strand:- start:1058 stop:1501 length:444 start_codon:yes stop_codon:yes gene_type:complete
MEFYTCNYCYTKFKPTRRRVQKYCSNTCRSKACYLRNQIKKPINTLIEKNIDTIQKEKINKVEQISAAGIGNATAGTLIADGLKSILTANENKPATKKDIEELKNILTHRYYPITNLRKDQNGRYPYYDIKNKHLVFLDNNNNNNTI